MRPTMRPGGAAAKSLGGTSVASRTDLSFGPSVASKITVALARSSHPTLLHHFSVLICVPLRSFAVPTIARRKILLLCGVIQRPVRETGIRADLHFRNRASQFGKHVLTPLTASDSACVGESAALVWHACC